MTSFAQQEVQKRIELFFENFDHKDLIKIKNVCSDKMILQSINENALKGNTLSDETVKEFYKSIPSIP